MSKLPERLIFEEQPVTAPPSPPIVAVTNRQQFQTFLQFPRQLYRGDPFWTPPFAVEEGYTFDAAHPFWKHAECQLFLYQDNGRTLGRVAVFADQHYIQQAGESVGCFGYFEAVNAVAVADALLNAARDWLAARGIQRLRGPINGKLENGCAFLLEGFNRPPFVTMPYNPPYYIELMEQLGLEKARDLVAYRIDLTQPIPIEVAAAAERCQAAGFRVREVNLRNWQQEREWLPKLLGLAFAEHWSNVAPPDDEYSYSIDEMRGMIDPGLCLVAEYAGCPVGLRWMTPDYAPILRQTGGRLLPTMLLSQVPGQITRGKSILMGLEKAYRGQGLGTCLNYYTVKEMQRRRYTELEYSWIDEQNWPSRRAGEKLGGQVDKRYRIYEMDVAGNGNTDV